MLNPRSLSVLLQSKRPRAQKPNQHNLGGKTFYSSWAGNKKGHSTSLLPEYLLPANTSTFSDLKIFSRDARHSFATHKAVFAALSNLNTLLQDDPCHDQVIFTELDSQGLELVSKFILTGTLDIAEVTDEVIEDFAHIGIDISSLDLSQEEKKSQNTMKTSIAIKMEPPEMTPASLRIQHHDRKDTVKISHVARTRGQSYNNVEEDIKNLEVQTSREKNKASFVIKSATPRNSVEQDEAVTLETSKTKTTLDQEEAKIKRTPTEKLESLEQAKKAKKLEKDNPDEHEIEGQKHYFNRSKILRKGGKK